MPQVSSTDYEALSLEATRLVRGFDLHDVWQVDLGAPSATLQQLRGLITPARMRTVHPMVRGLFAICRFSGRLLRLDRESARPPGEGLLDGIPRELARASLIKPGTPVGPFTTLYELPAEGAYEALNATVHAILVVALVEIESGQRLFWATHLKPIGRITGLYMGFIDPFRRHVVYPGLEKWAKSAWAAARDEPRA